MPCNRKNSRRHAGVNMPARRRRAPTLGTFIVPAFIAGALVSVAAPAAGAAPTTSLCGAYASSQFGPDVCVFTPPTGTDAASELQAIQTVVNDIAAQQVPVSAQFDDQGYALLFEPGTYGSATDPLVFQVGYYTEVAGLGAVPQDTIINGQVDVFPTPWARSLAQATASCPKDKRATGPTRQTTSGVRCPTSSSTSRPSPARTIRRHPCPCRRPLAIAVQTVAGRGRAPSAPTPISGPSRRHRQSEAS